MGDEKLAVNFQSSELLLMVVFIQNKFKQFNVWGVRSFRLFLRLGG